MSHASSSQPSSCAEDPMMNNHVTCVTYLLCSFLQRELVEHQTDIVSLKENLVEMIGADSEPVSEVASHQKELERQLEEAGKLAALLQAEVADRERCQNRLDCDIQSLMDWLSGAVEKLNQLSVSTPSESDDELLRRHNAVKVIIHVFFNVYIINQPGFDTLLLYSSPLWWTFEEPSLTWNNSEKYAG